MNFWNDIEEIETAKNWGYSWLRLDRYFSERIFLLTKARCHIRVLRECDLITPGCRICSYILEDSSEKTISQLIRTPFQIAPLVPMEVLEKCQKFENEFVDLLDHHADFDSVGSSFALTPEEVESLSISLRV